MRMQIHTLSKENYPQIIEWLENIFTEMGLSQKEIYKGEILLEENFYHFAKASGDEDKFIAQVEITKHFGDVSIRLTALGNAYDPLSDICKVPEDEREKYSLAILKAHKDDISYARKNDANMKG